MENIANIPSKGIFGKKYQKYQIFFSKLGYGYPYEKKMSNVKYVFFFFV